MPAYRQPIKSILLIHNILHKESSLFSGYTLFRAEASWRGALRTPPLGQACKYYKYLHC